MQKHEIIESYVSEVCRQVRWKKARRVIAAEISDHIGDQIGAYVGEGLNEAFATERAVAEMGDPVEAGRCWIKCTGPGRTGGSSRRRSLW